MKTLEGRRHRDGTYRTFDPVAEAERGHRIGAALLIAFVALILFALVRGAVAGGDIVGRASVIDGDTIEIRGERIRLHGIDAPESRQQCQRGAEQWRCGQRAAFALADYVAARPVRCAPVGRDRYGRTVARCYQGDTDLQDWLTRQGLALAYRRYSTEYVAAEEAARASGAGMWAGTFKAPWDWRRGH